MHSVGSSPAAVVGTGSTFPTNTNSSEESERKVYMEDDGDGGGSGGGGGGGGRARGLSQSIASTSAEFSQLSQAQSQSEPQGQGQGQTQTQASTPISLQSPVSYVVGRSPAPSATNFTNNQQSPVTITQNNTQVLQLTPHQAEALASVGLGALISQSSTYTSPDSANSVTPMSPPYSSGSEMKTSGGPITGGVSLLSPPLNPRQQQTGTPSATSTASHPSPYSDATISGNTGGMIPRQLAMDIELAYPSPPQPQSNSSTAASTPSGIAPQPRPYYPPPTPLGGSTGHPTVQRHHPYAHPSHSRPSSSMSSSSIPTYLPVAAAANAAANATVSSSISDASSASNQTANSGSASGIGGLNPPLPVQRVHSAPAHMFPLTGGGTTASSGGTSVMDSIVHHSNSHSLQSTTSESNLEHLQQQHQQNANRLLASSSVDSMRLDDQQQEWTLDPGSGLTSHPPASDWEGDRSMGDRAGLVGGKIPDQGAGESSITGNGFHLKQEQATQQQQQDSASSGIGGSNSNGNGGGSTVGFFDAPFPYTTTSLDTLSPYSAQLTPSNNVLSRPPSVIPPTPSFQIDSVSPWIALLRNRLPILEAALSNSPSDPGSDEEDIWKGVELAYEELKRMMISRKDTRRGLAVQSSKRSYAAMDSDSSSLSTPVVERVRELAATKFLAQAAPPPLLHTQSSPDGLSLQSQANAARLGQAQLQLQAAQQAHAQAKAQAEAEIAEAQTQAAQQIQAQQQAHQQQAQEAQAARVAEAQARADIEMRTRAEDESRVKMEEQREADAQQQQQQQQAHAERMQQQEQLYQQAIAQQQAEQQHQAIQVQQDHARQIHQQLAQAQAHADHQMNQQEQIQAMEQAQQNQVRAQLQLQAQHAQQSQQVQQALARQQQQQQQQQDLSSSTPQQMFSSTNQYGLQNSSFSQPPGQSIHTPHTPSPLSAIIPAHVPISPSMSVQQILPGSRAIPVYSSAPSHSLMQQSSNEMPLSPPIQMRPATSYHAAPKLEAIDTSTNSNGYNTNSEMNGGHPADPARTAAWSATNYAALTAAASGIVDMDSARAAATAAAPVAGGGSGVGVAGAGGAVGVPSSAGQTLASPTNPSSLNSLNTIRPPRSRAASGSGYVSTSDSRSRAASGSGYQSLLESRSRAASSASSAFGTYEQDEDDEDDEMDDDAPSKASSQMGAASAGVDPALRAAIDPIFLEFLAELCSNLDATDSKGEPIHQTLMAKKMERLDQSNDFRPFKFRIQAFTTAFSEKLSASGFAESDVPVKKIRQYLWAQPCISRFNDDGKKAKSKGNHIWTIEAKKVPGKKWIFREFVRCIKGHAPAVAFVGLPWIWQPRVWDPQCSASAINATFTSPSLPNWLSWDNNNVLFGHAPESIRGQTVEVQAAATFTTSGKLQHLEATLNILVASVGDNDAEICRSIEESRQDHSAVTSSTTSPMSRSPIVNPSSIFGSGDSNKNSLQLDPTSQTPSLRNTSGMPTPSSAVNPHTFETQALFQAADLKLLDNQRASESQQMQLEQDELDHEQRQQQQQLQQVLMQQQGLAQHHQLSQLSHEQLLHQQLQQQQSYPGLVQHVGANNSPMQTMQQLNNNAGSQQQQQQFFSIDNHTFPRSASPSTYSYIAVNGAGAASAKHINSSFPTLSSANSPINTIDPQHLSGGTSTGTGSSTGSNSNGNFNHMAEVDGRLASFALSQGPSSQHNSFTTIDPSNL